jgi:hypothetical protein
VQPPPQPEGFVSRHRFILLFATLVVCYVLLPFLHQLSEAIDPGYPPILERVVLVVLLTGAVASASSSRAGFLFALLLGLLATALWVVNALIDSNTLAVVQHLLAGTFLGYVIWVILLAIFAGRRATFNTVCASLCIYLLLGLVWAMAYSVVDVLDPNAFAWTVPGIRPRAHFRLGSGNGAVVYFSFTTLTTLGYGDIVPTSPISRMLATVEAITGQLYLAVLVARLVGLHIAESLGQGQSNEPSGGGQDPPAPKH